MTIQIVLSENLKCIKCSFYFPVHSYTLFDFGKVYFLKISSKHLVLRNGCFCAVFSPLEVKGTIIKWVSSVYSLFLLSLIASVGETFRIRPGRERKGWLASYLITLSLGNLCPTINKDRPLSRSYLKKAACKTL